MALRVGSDWLQFFLDANVPAEESKEYAKIFVGNRMTEELLSEITKDTLRELGIPVLGDILAILRHAKKYLPPAEQMPKADCTSTVKPPSAKLPQLTSDMTLPQFRKFLIDWNVFKRITNISETQIHAQLYSCCDDIVQNTIVNTVPDIFSVSEANLLGIIESIVTKHSNPSVHRMNFGSIIQSPAETIQEFVVRLRSLAPYCEFTCPNCTFDLQSNHIRDQFIRGLYNETLQADILAKASHLTTLEDIIKYSEAFEAAMRDQQKLQYPSEAMSAKFSTYKRNNTSKNTLQKQPCSGCGSYTHGQRNSKDRPTQCPAWGTVCHNCQIPNHFARVCRRKKDSANALIASVWYNAKTDTYIPKSNTSVEQIDVTLSPCLPQHRKSSPIVMKVFPDSGASICLAGTQHIKNLNLSPADLIPCNKQVTAVGGSQITCIGWLPMTFEIGSHSTKQPLYICEKVDRIYLGRRSCSELKILPPSFPYPMPNYIINESVHTANHIETSEIPRKPHNLPYLATDDNVNRLKQYLIDSFKSTAFNKCSPFPAMETKPVHIHLKPDAKPHAQHVPIPVPFHWKSDVKNDLDLDVERGIIKPVPIGTPVQWCSRMLVTAKKNGKPRRVVDFQKLNAQCLRETHHCPSPFQAVVKYQLTAGRLCSMQ